MVTQMHLLSVVLRLLKTKTKQKPKQSKNKQTKTATQCLQNGNLNFVGLIQCLSSNNTQRKSSALGSHPTIK